MPKIEDFERIIQQLKDHEKRIVKLENSTLKGTKSESLDKRMSIQEFLLSKKPKNDVEKTLAIGYFLEKYENLEFFNKNDLEKSFKKAKVPPPQNINDKVNANIKKGYIMEVDEKKENLKCWCLSQSGTMYCENNFKKE